MMTKRAGALFALLVLAGILALSQAAFAQEPVIALYSGAAPGSENWTQQETVSPAFWDRRVKLVRNVVRPTLTAYLPKSNATGTAVIVAPGGGFRFLSWESEGAQVAEWLAQHGVAAFVLKYRLIDTGASEPEFESAMKAMFAALLQPRKPGAGTSPPSDPAMERILPLAADDGRQAVKLVRQRAAEWNISPDRIGLMGFSAGAMVTGQVSLHHTADTRPNFVAPIYGPVTGDIPVPEDAPPAFVLCANDDPLAASGSARLYMAWHDAGKPAELHVYSKGGHGFGMQRHGLPVDHWIERFQEWMQAQGLLGSGPARTQDSATPGAQGGGQADAARRAAPPIPNPDWPALKHYQAANASLPPAVAGKPRVVFMGDSITQGWAERRASFFDDNGYVGRGISGQTSPQMLLRFHQDVVALRPAAVVILAGTNDVAENTGPMTDEQTIDNLAAMTEIARANGIKVVIGSVPPATIFSWHRDIIPAPRIKALNAKIKAWAQAQRVVYADFWTAMAAPDGTMNPANADDTVHPNAAGYAIMEPIVQAAISEALKSKP